MVRYNVVITMAGSCILLSVTWKCADSHSRDAHIVACWSGFVATYATGFPPGLDDRHPERAQPPCVPAAEQVSLVGQPAVQAIWSAVLSCVTSYAV